MAIDPRDKQANFDKMADYVKKAADQDVDLILFPEMALSGYGTAGMQQYSAEDKFFFIECSELVPEGDTTQKMIDLAKQHGIYICWGMPEKDADRTAVTYNCVVLVGPEGFVGKYRKTHQPLCERLELFPGKGDYQVFGTSIGKIGLEICFDMCFPEVARSLAIQGADIILSPICWPNMSGSLDDPDHHAHLSFSRARAWENMIFFVDSTYSGEAMSGYAQIIGPNAGQVMAVSGFDEEMVVAEFDLEKEITHARTVTMGGSDLLKDRKPWTYGLLTESDR